MTESERADPILVEYSILPWLICLSIYENEDQKWTEILEVSGANELKEEHTGVWKRISRSEI